MLDFLQRLRREVHQCSRTADKCSMAGIPLLFTYRDRIVGMGFTALVHSYGRVLGVVEGEGDIGIYGVEPGALAAKGADPKEALEAFRQDFTDILRDFASEAQSFGEFEQSTQGFFSAINRPTEATWLEAVQAVRTGQIDLPDMRKEPAESRRFVQVIEERAADHRPTFAVTGSEITSTITA